MKIHLLGLILLLPWLCGAQTQADWWYFGDKAGVHFTSMGPVADLDGQLKSTEGCASISDAFGNLLFYTRGDTVWDASHNVMQDGTGLTANGAAGDGAMNSYIVPRPGDPSEFYLFTVTSFSGGLYYSKVDMTLNSGLGGVDTNEKNIPLVSSTLEMVTCLRQPNNYDFWVVTLKKPGDTAFAFEVTSNGVNTQPVLSNTGLSLDMGDILGYLKGSQQNDRIGLTLFKGMATQVNADQVHLLDFDNVTGEVSYAFGITPSQADSLNYGIEFSPNGQYLYVQSLFHPDLRQYDFSSGVAATVSASEEFVGNSYTGSGGGALHLGPDGKIYGARNVNGFLSSVEFPNSAGALCGYNHDAVNLQGRLSFAGLPQFFPFFIEGGAVAIDGCLGDTSFFMSSYLTSDSVFWNFGDPTSGALDTSTQQNPFHVYTAPGTYTITHIGYSAFLSDTTILELTIKPRQQFDFPDDTVLCEGQTIFLDLPLPGVISYLWHDGSTDSTFTVIDSGLVSLDVLGVCDTVSDTMKVIRLEPFNLDLGPDTVICDDSMLTLSSGVPAGYSLLWSDGSLGDNLEIDSSGVYSVVVASPCDTMTDSILVNFQPTPGDSLLPPDTTLCTDAPLLLALPQQEGVSYLWSDSTDVDVFVVDTTRPFGLRPSTIADCVWTP